MKFSVEDLDLKKLKKSEKMSLRFSVNDGQTSPLFRLVNKTIFAKLNLKMFTRPTKRYHQALLKLYPTFPNLKFFSLAKGLYRAWSTCNFNK